MGIVRAAVAQAASAGFDREASLARVRALALEAAGRGAELVLFPEAFVGGYPRGMDFGATVGARSDAGREWFRRHAAGASEIPGPTIDALAATAAEATAALVVGVIEREGGTLYCSVVVVDRDGRYVGKHRKLMPTAAERLIWGFGDGSTLGPFETSAGRLGVAICWENYMPLLRAHLFAQGVAIYCAPTADARESWLATMRHVALEGRCFVLSGNQCVRRRDLPDDYPAYTDKAPDDVICRGGSVVIDPLGRVLAGPLWDSAGVLVADLDLDEIPRGKFDLDVAGHYARPDVFRLLVNDRPMPPAVSGPAAWDDWG